jgi:hypothetical protein
VQRREPTREQPHPARAGVAGARRCSGRRGRPSHAQRLLCDAARAEDWRIVERASGDATNEDKERMPERAWRRRWPEQTAPTTVVQEHLGTFVQQVRDADPAGSGLPGRCQKPSKVVLRLVLEVPSDSH